MKAVIFAAALISASLLHGQANASVHDMNGNAVDPYSRWSGTMKLPTPNVDASVIVDSERGELSMCSAKAEACTLENNIWMWTGSKRAVFLHELGHVVDYQLMTPSARLQFRTLIGDMRPWNVDEADPPNESFAEAYSFCARTGARNLGLTVNWISWYGYDPSLPQHKSICSLISRVSVLDRRQP